MQIGMVGLGRMGGNMTRRLMAGGHDCIVWDRDPVGVAGLVAEGAGRADSLEALVKVLAPPRTVWVMVPAGSATEQTVAALGDYLDDGDTIVDGGNTYFKDDVRRASILRGKGIRYLDVGTSGGVWGRERGYCLTIGGDESGVEHLEPIFKTLAPGSGDVGPTPGWAPRASTADQGWVHCGPSGAGHFVKMVHNGIEYGLMQAYAEGFDILKSAGSEDLAENIRYDIDLADVAQVWRRGSVVGSWLLDLTATALTQDPVLSDYSGFVEDSGEGRWAINAAVEEGVPAAALAAALFARFRSRQEHTFAEKVLSAMRHKFGGHLERTDEN